MVGLQIIVGHEGPYNSHGPIAYRMVGHNGVGRTSYEGGGAPSNIGCLGGL
jgi:hypothetical protein